MEGLSLDNILTGSDIENLFTDQEIQESEPDKSEDNSTEELVDIYEPELSFIVVKL